MVDSGNVGFPRGVWEISINSPEAFWRILSVDNFADSFRETTGFAP